MSIKCTHCGGRHSKVETVRQCAIDAGVPEESLPVLRRELWLPTLGPIEPVRHRRDMVPAGYYWLPGSLVAKVRIPAEGRWKGRYFVSLYEVAVNDEQPVFSRADREEFLRWLFGQPWKHFMVRYGGKTGYCGACGGKISAPRPAYGVHNEKNGPYGSACFLASIGKYVIQGE